MEIHHSERNKGIHEREEMIHMKRQELEGEIKVEGTLTIQEQGSVSGSIEYQEIQVKLGGKIKGEIKSLDKIKKISDIKTKTFQDTSEKLETNKS